MRIAIVGAGGVGGLVGGLLAHAGDEVAFVARGKQLEALRARGLRVESPRATFELSRVEAADDPSQLAAAEVVLVAVKSWQVPEIAPRLASLIAPGGFVVPLENGVDAAPTLVRALGEERVAGGFCAMLAWLDSPGLIKHAGEVLRVVVGERTGGGSLRLERLVERLNAARVDASIAPDIEAALWEKFLFIAAFGGVAAAARVPAAAVRTTPETRALLTAAMEEIAQLARARGVRLAEAAVRDALAVVDALPAHATASMQRDIQAGRPSELQDQLGAVVRLASQAGVAVPTCKSLLAVLLPQELAARG
ncbi:MAG TPA: 2-dehydropantoate 2-reductase [Polyangiales bacterium]|nr:2-dehydropantoate 2-reductase [Polyangiales bacterium]